MISSKARTGPIRQKVLNYFEQHPDPVRFSLMARQIRETGNDFTDSDLLNTVQPLILTGELAYTPDLKITAPSKHSK